MDVFKSFQVPSTRSTSLHFYLHRRNKKARVREASKACQSREWRSADELVPLLLTNLPRHCRGVATRVASIQPRLLHLTVKKCRFIKRTNIIFIVCNKQRNIISPLAQSHDGKTTRKRFYYRCRSRARVHSGIRDGLEWATRRGSVLRLCRALQTRINRPPQGSTRPFSRGCVPRRVASVTTFPKYEDYQHGWDYTSRSHEEPANALPLINYESEKKGKGLVLSFCSTVARPVRFRLGNLESPRDSNAGRPSHDVPLINNIDKRRTIINGSRDNTACRSPTQPFSSELQTAHDGSMFERRRYQGWLGEITHYTDKNVMEQR